jgi:hypothetical protein
MSKFIALILMMIFALDANAKGSTNHIINSSTEIEIRPANYVEIYGDVKVMANNEVRFLELSGSDYVSLKSPSSVGSSLDFILPASYGSSGHCLKGDGAGVLSFGACLTASPISATDQQVVFGIGAGSGSGKGTLTFNYSTDSLFLDGTFTLTGNLVGSGSGSFEDGIKVLNQNPIELQDSAGGEYKRIRTHATTTSHTVTLPANVCAADQVWIDDGSGNMSCADQSGGGGGENFLPDGGFETALNFTCNHANQTCATATSPNYDTNGTNVAKIDASASATYDAEYCVTNTEFEGNNFEVGCMMKTASELINLCASNDSGSGDNCSDYKPDASNEWLEIKNSMIVPASGKACVRITSDSGTTDDVYVDSCFIRNLKTQAITKIYTEHLRHTAANSTLTDRTNELEFDTANFTSTGDDVITLDNSSGTRTKFICNRAKCFLKGVMSLEPSDSTTSQSIAIYDSIAEGAFSAAATCGNSSSHPTSGYETTLLAAFECELGRDDFITIRLFQDLANNANGAILNMTATYIEQDQVLNDNLEGTFGIKWYNVANCSDGTSNSSYEDLVDAADCTFASATKIGNVVTPTTTGAFALKTGKVKKGKYRVSFGGSLYAEQITQCGFRLFDGTNIVGPVIVQNGHAATYVAAIDGYSEIIEYTSDQASVEWKLQAIDMAASANACVAQAGTVNSGSAVSISMEPATSEMIAALGDKVSAPNTSNSKTYFASINCDASSSIVNQTFTGTATIGNISGGSCAITIPSGNFTDASRISCESAVTASNNSAAMLNFTFTSTTSLSIFCVDHNATNCTSFDSRLQCTQY